MKKSTLILTIIVLLSFGIGVYLYLANKNNVPENSKTTNDTTASVNNAESDKSDLKKSVYLYSENFLSGNGEEAFSQLSKACKEKTAKPEFLSGVESAKELYGNMPIKTFNIDQISGNLATISYTYENSSINQASESWIKEDNKWQNNDC